MRSLRTVLLWVPLCAACSGPTDKPTDTDVGTDTDDTDGLHDTDDTDAALDTDDTDAADTDVAAQGELNPCGSATPVLTVGTGASEYVPVAEQSELRLTKGVQGGWHFWMSVSIQNSPQYVIIEHRVTRMSDGTLLAPEVRENDVLVPTTLTNGCVQDGVYYGMQARIDTTTFTTDPPWEEFCGEQVRLELRVFWPRCARFDGPLCVEHEEVLLGEDSVIVVAKPDASEAADCAL